MTNRLTYRAKQGEYWERLILVKDRDSRRIIRPLEAWANIKTSALTVKEINCFITSEGGILMQLSEEDTADLPAGNLEFDVVAQHYKYQRLTYGSLAGAPGISGSGDVVTRVVAKGIIKVEALGNITPLEEADYMELRFNRYEDFYRNFTWRDEEGDVIAIQNAYMQAKDSNGVVVLDLRWAEPALTEAEIVALPDAKRKGYITLNTDGSIAMHVSNLNSIPVGAHKYDIFVQDSSGDWSVLVKGTIIVEETISVMPS
jgi:hypothetical protein